MTLKWIIVSLALIASFAGCSNKMPERPAIEVWPIEGGAPFPPLLLPDLDGRPGSVADWRGKKLILHIFASW